MPNFNATPYNAATFELTEFSESLAESITSSDSTLKVFATLKSESVSSVDTVSKLAALAALVETLSEVDSLTKMTGVTVTESLTPFVSQLTDSDSFMAAGELLSLNDTAAKLDMLTTLLETMKIDDSKQHLPTFYNGGMFNTKQYNSTITTIHVLLMPILTKLESLTPSDTLATLRIFMRNYTETLTTVDQRLTKAIKSLVDSIFMGESIQHQVVGKLLSERIRPSDWLQVNYVIENRWS